MTDQSVIHQLAARQRSSLYRLLAEMLTYPTNELWQSCCNGDRDRSILELLGALPYELCWSARNFDFDRPVAKLASEYMRVFELPIDGQPCPLYGGVYSGNRRDVMEELLRYYRFFGLSIDHAEDGDLPDSIPTLLEFLQFLTYKESDNTVAEEVTSIRLVQRDLLDRHLTKWVPEIRIQLDNRKPPLFYRNTINLLDEFTTAELAYLL